MTFLGTNTWILSEPDAPVCVVVDPGPDDTSHQENILKVCAKDGLVIGAIALTHSHPDHGEGALSLARRTSAPVFQKKDKTLDAGPFSFPGSPLQLSVVLLPGHSGDSVGFSFLADHSIVTGDVIFGQSPSVICWPDGRLVEYFSSLQVLRRLAQEGYGRFLTGHGPPIEDPIAAIEESEAHRRERIEQVRQAQLKAPNASINELMSTIYANIDTQLVPAAQLSLLAQLQYLSDLERC
jgi:glyoxylase-like metal-dependent hydrolase (beta-lactamase superfamily II)